MAQPNKDLSEDKKKEELERIKDTNYGTELSPGKGYFLYPFELRLPDWLPASSMITTSG